MVTPRRKKIALAIAALGDALQLGFFPAFVEGALSPPDDVLDAVVGVLLLLTLGWKWRLVGALALELVPGVALFPTWTAFVMTIPTEVPAPPALPAVEAPPELETSVPSRPSGSRPALGRTSARR